MSSIQFVVFASMFAVLLVVLFVLSWPLTLLVLALGSLAMWMMSRYLMLLPRLGERTSQAAQEMTHAIQENLGAVYLIQSQNRVNAQIAAVSEKIDAYRRADNRLAVRTYWVQPLNEILGVLVIGLLIVATLLLPSRYQLQLPRLLPFLYVLIRMVQTLKILNDSRAIITARRPYLRQVDDLLKEDNKPFLTDGEELFPGLSRKIVFDRVWFNYPLCQSVLKGISFLIPAGKTTAIVGRSGSGKSTLTNLLLRFYDPSQGRILVDGRSLTAFRRDSYRQRIGVVSQETFLFNASVKVNIAFGMEEEASDDQIIEAAKRAGAHDFICELPAGYETPLGDRGVKLSGGERQRIAIARAILKTPEILILDEATSSLDTIIEQQIHDTVLSLGPDCTTLIIAHRSSTVQHADRVIVLKDGTVVESGAPEELLRLNGEFAALMHRSDTRLP
jgi:subfamily B ATP-binding cassette protein MsbA